MNLIQCFKNSFAQTIVVYFDQRKGACWLKSIVFALKQVFSPFSVTNKKREKRKGKHKKQQKGAQKGVYQHLGVTPKHWLTPISWLTPRKKYVFC